MPPARGLLLTSVLALAMLLAAVPATAEPAPPHRLLLTLDHALTGDERAALAAIGWSVVGDAPSVPAVIVASVAPRASPASLAFVRASTPDAPLFTDALLPLGPQPDPTPDAPTGTPPAPSAPSAPAQPLTLSSLDAPSNDVTPSLLTRAGEPTWSLGATGKGIAIAVVDSGIDGTHPDFAGRVVANVKLVGTQFVPSAVDDDGHGTHVAGIAAGNGAASHGVYAGVAPDANLVGIDINADFTTASALEAFDWIFLHKDQYNIRVVTNSWGRASTGEAFDPNDALVRATDRLVRAGIVVVFSASNHGPAPASLSLEAQNPDVLTVGATDDAASLASFSSRGPARDASGAPASWIKPDLVAPGVDVVAPRSVASVSKADPDAPSYQIMSGTSQAAPQVAGVVADMLSVAPALRPADVAVILHATAVDLGAPGADTDTGYGLVDARDAVLAALGRTPDHGNLLVQGGAQSFAFAGSTLAAGGAASGLLNGLTGGARETTVTARFPVLPGAPGATIDFAYSAGLAPSALRLYVSDGDQTLGPWTGRNGVANIAAPDLHPGMWTLAVIVTSAASVTWSATVHEVLAAHAERASIFDPRYELPPGERGVQQSVSDEFQYLVDLATVELEVRSVEFQDYADAHPLVVVSGLFAGLAAIAGLAWWAFGSLAKARRRARLDQAIAEGPTATPLPPLPVALDAAGGDAPFEVADEAPTELPPLDLDKPFDLPK
ncbi:MAG: S8 family serine peptidase [Thermoplasmatota archaeon]